MIEDSIDDLSPVPRYLLIAGIIRARIERGELEPGRPIPSRRMIHQEYGVAATTVHRALRVLVGEGLVVVVPGMGARVARKQ
jgi:GntR family transcriptional regulator